MAGNKIRALRQGALGSECGIYATINSVRAATNKDCRLSREDCHDLYRSIIYDLEERGVLASVLYGGSGIHLLCSFLRTSSKWLLENKGWYIDYRRPWVRQSAQQPLDVVFQNIEDHLAQGNTSVITWVFIVVDHWTVIRSITADSIHLIDSSGHKHIPKSKCITDRPHVVMENFQVGPTATFLIRASKA